MTKLSQLEELQSAIETAAHHVPDGVSSLEAAEKLFRSEPELIGLVAETWIIHELGRQIGRIRAKLRRANTPQFAFEDLLGFRRLPATAKIIGKPIPREEWTIDEARAVARGIQEKNPAHQAVLRMIELFEKHTRRKKKITWAEVVELEAKKAGKRA